MTDPFDGHDDLVRMAMDDERSMPAVAHPPSHWHPLIKHWIYGPQLSGQYQALARGVFAKYFAGETEYPRGHGFANLLTDDEDETEPMIGRRTDGQPLFYRYAYNILWGQPQARKSWVAMVAIKQIVLSQFPQRCVYFDYEDSARHFKQRLRQLGCGAQELERPNSWGADGKGWPWVDYRASPGDLRLDLAGEFGLLENLSGMGSPAIIVVDGVDAFCTAHGYDSNLNTDWGALVDEVLNPFCTTGAAVILIDHVAKGKDANMKYPIGASQKLARCRGAAYDVSRVSETASKLVLRKDTNGQLGASLGATAAELVLEGNGLYTQKLRLRATGGTDGTNRRVQELMTRGMRALKTEDGLNTRQLREAIGGGHTGAAQAIGRLVERGDVETRPGAGNATLHYLVTPDR